MGKVCPKTNLNNKYKIYKNDKECYNNIVRR